MALAGSTSPPPYPVVPAAGMPQLAETVRSLAATLLGAQKVRIVRLQALKEGEGRWRVDLEAFIPNPEITVEAQGVTKAILERHYYRLDLDEAGDVHAFAPIDAG